MVPDVFYALPERRVEDLVAMTQRTEAGGEEREGGWEWRGVGSAAWAAFAFERVVWSALSGI